MNLRKYVILTKVAGTVFKGAFKSQLKDPDTLSVSAAAGLVQGLKYKGNIKTGAITAITVAGVLGTWNGVSNVIEHWDDIVKISTDKYNEKPEFIGVSED